MSWDEVAISDFCRTGSGGTPSRSKASRYYGGSIPWVKSGELREKSVYKTEEYVTEDALRESAIKLVPPGALLIAMYGATVGRMATLKIEATTNQAVCHIIPDEKKADPNYLNYALQNKVPYLLKKRVGGGQPNISQQIIKDTKIPLPPLPEQRRIAAILDKADAIRRKRQQAIRLTEEFLRSVFLDMFGDPVLNPKGWETAKLADLCKRVTDGTHQSPRWEITGIPFLFVSNIVKGKISFDTQKFISEESWRELTRRCPIEVDDLLYTTVGSYGNAAMVLEERKFCFQRHIAHIKPDSDKINSKFLLGQMLSPAVKRQADKQARGVAQKTLNLKELKEFVILVPPGEDQLKYVAILDGVEKTLERQAEALSQEESLFNSLVQRAFRGEL